MRAGREPREVRAPLEPPTGRVLHGWGQLSGAWTRDLACGRGDEEDLCAYEADVAPASPAMLSCYVAPVPEQTGALLPKLARLAQERGRFVVQLGLYLHAIQARVARGELDDPLRALATGLRALDLPVLLRVGYEFNNPWQRHEPRTYVAAFRRVAALFGEEEARRVAPVWHASGLGLGRSEPWPWHPGDDVAVWWGVSLFHHEELTLPQLGPVLDEARARGRPVLVGEASPVLASRLPFRVRGPRSDGEALRWYARLFALVEARPEVKALSLIAVDWRRLRRELPGFGWPDVRLSRWPAAAARVREEVARPRWIGRGEWQAAEDALTPLPGSPVRGADGRGP